MPLVCSVISEVWVLTSLAGALSESCGFLTISVSDRLAAINSGSLVVVSVVSNCAALLTEGGGWEVEFLVNNLPS